MLYSSTIKPSIRDARNVRIIIARTEKRLCKIFANPKIIYNNIPIDKKNNGKKKNNFNRKRIVIQQY